MLLRQRHRQPEVMDQPDLSPSRHVAALRGLKRINFWSRSAHILWPPIAALAYSAGPRPLRVLDVASGGGDVALRLWRWGRRAGLDLRIEGCDLSPVAVDYAQSCAARAGANIHFYVHDALDGPPLAYYDAVMSSLFLHHLAEDQACTLLGRLAEAANHLVLINDLVRSWTGWVLARVGTRLLSSSAVVHIDGPRSVEGAFTIAEVHALAERAGLQGAAIARCWPCRFLLTWRRP